jgi:hypothetical protein
MYSTAVRYSLPFQPNSNDTWAVLVWVIDSDEVIHYSTNAISIWRFECVVLFAEVWEGDYYWRCSRWKGDAVGIEYCNNQLCCNSTESVTVG